MFAGILVRKLEMNRICFCIMVLGLSVFYGCAEQQKSEPQFITGKTDAKFPKFLVGVWQANDFNWGFKFEPDGKISKLTHVLGAPITVEEGSYYEEGIDGSSFLYVLGPYNTSYDPNTGILKVSVIMDYFLMDLPWAGSIEGSEKDFFEGPVSKKDLTWNVKWRNYCYVEGASLPDVNAIDDNPQELIFRKVNPELLEKHKHQPSPPVQQQSK
jgi:hypothetical protein